MAEEGAGITRKEDAYRRIIAIVMASGLESNTVLNEQKLAESFGMSRAPVREALQMLCAERILSNVPRLGYTIVPISIRETLDAIDMRLILETEGVRLACRNRSGSAIATIESLIARERGFAGRSQDIHQWIMDGDLVHKKLAELSRNMVLSRTVASTLDLLRRASIQLILEGKKGPDGIHYHLRILEAVLAGDEEAAVDLLKKDIRILRDIITNG